MVRSKGVSSKKVKVHNSSRPGSKKDKVEVKVKSEDQTQVSHTRSRCLLHHQLSDSKVLGL